jgi:hypothetical protein
MDTKTYRKHTEVFFMGKKVRTLIQMRNGYMVIPEGTTCEITRKYQGFNLTSEPCKCCGVRISINRVPYRDVELIR